MINCTLDKPVKIIMVGIPSGCEPDYETVGKLIDNIIIMSVNQKLDLHKEGKLYHCEFVVGKKYKFNADFKVMKTMYLLVISYIKELTKFEATRAFAVPPKEKMMIKEAEKEAKKQLKEKKEKEKADKENSKKTTKKTVKKKEVVKNDYPDLD